MDYNLIRTEASVLVDLGRVDDGVKLIQGLIDTKPTGVAPSIMYDDFINYLFISSLYTQSKIEFRVFDKTRQRTDLAMQGKHPWNAQISPVGISG